MDEPSERTVTSISTAVPAACVGAGELMEAMSECDAWHGALVVGVNEEEQVLRSEESSPPGAKS